MKKIQTKPNEPYTVALRRLEIKFEEQKLSFDGLIDHVNNSNKVIVKLIDKSRLHKWEIRIMFVVILIALGV